MTEKSNERRNPRATAAEMRATKKAVDTTKLAATWREFRGATPIGVEVFLPVELCQALDQLADEVEAQS